MKTLKVTLALLSVGIGALFAVSAAEALGSPRAAANANPAPAATTPAAASPHAMGCMGMAGGSAPAPAPAAGANASAHCQSPKTGHAHMACCN